MPAQRYRSSIITTLEETTDSSTGVDRRCRRR